MRLSRPVLLAIGALACGAMIGWASAAMREKTPATNGGKATNAAHTASSGAGSLDSAKAATGPKFSGVLDGNSPPSPQRFSGASPKFIRAVHNALAIKDTVDRGARLREIMRGIPVEDLPAACENAKKSIRSDGDTVLTALGNRWAEADPQAGVEFASKFENIGSNPGSYPLLWGVVDRWSMTAPAETANWVEAMASGKARTNLLSMVIFHQALDHPEQALQVMLRQSTSGDGRWYAGNLFTQWAENDTNAAAAAALQLQGEMGQAALQAVALRMSQEDPAKGLAWASAVPDLSARKDLITSITDQWSEADPKAEIAWARGLSDGAMRRDEMTKGIAVLAGTDLSAALDQIHALPAGKDRETAVQAAATRLAGKDARSALQLLSELPSGPSRNQIMGRVCSTWGQSDPQGALDWFARHSGPLAKSASFGAISQTFQGWIANSPDEAISWAKALPAGDDRDAAMATAVGGLTETDLDRAQTLFGELSPGAQKTAAYGLTNALFLQDANKAQSFAASLPPGPTQNNALNTVAAQMADSDPVSAAQWLGTLIPGAGLDSAISGFGMATVSRDPEAALAWTLTIGDQKDREKQTETLVSIWLTSDAAAARAWLDANQQITSDEKRRILHPD